MNSPAVPTNDTSTRGAHALRRSLRLQADLDAARTGGQQVILTGVGVHDLLLDQDERTLRLPAFLRSYCQARQLGLVTFRLSDGARVEPTLPGDTRPDITINSSAPVSAGDLVDVLEQATTCGDPVLTVFDYADNFADPEMRTDTEHASAVERLQTLTADFTWRRGGHMLVVVDRGSGLTRRLASHPGFRTVHLGTPDPTEMTLLLRRATQATAESRLQLEPGLTVDEAARRFNGLLYYAAHALKPGSSEALPVTTAQISALKGEAITAMSNGAVELLSDTATFAADVAGLAAVRLEVADAARRGQHTVRLLLCGPAGTGKTLSATAIGNMLQVPVVRLGQILDPYLGVAEQNMERAMRVLRDLAPLVLFLDEADQRGLGGRGRGSDSHQAHQNMRAAMFEFLGDSAADNGVSVVAATNVASRLDDAARSRLTVIPVLFASAPELAQIMTIHARKAGIALDSDLEPTLASYLNSGHALSGRSAPRVLARALTAAQRGGRTTVTAKDVASTLQKWVSDDWTQDAEYSTLTSLLAADHADVWPWTAAQILGEPYEMPAYLAPYLNEQQQVDLALMRRRVADLGRSGAYGG